MSSRARAGRVLVILGAVSLSEQEVQGQFAACTTACLGGEASAKVRADIERGNSLGVSGTPVFFLGSKEADGSVSVVRPIDGAASQASPSSSSFDVASVKPSRPDGLPRPPTFGQTQFSLSNVTLEALIRFAYRVPVSHEVIGVPSWGISDRFDIVASYPPDMRRERVARTPEMIQSLLEERFRLVVRTETRDGRVSALVLDRADGRLGPRLNQSSVDPERDDGGTRERREVGPAGESLITRSQQNWPLAHLVDYLAGRLGQPVLDRTGLTGMFDYELTYAPATLRADAASIAEGPTLFAALREQLGLRLESVRAPVDVLVVEHVERPDPD